MMDHPNCDRMQEAVSALRADMAAAEKEHESFRRRLKDHDDSLKQLTDLTVAVKSMGQAVSNQAEALNRQSKSIENVEKRLGTLEAAPGESWKKMTFEVLKYIVLAVVGAIVLKNL